MVLIAVIVMLIYNFISGYHMVWAFHQLHAINMNDPIRCIGFLIFSNSAFCAKHMFFKMKWAFFLWKWSWICCEQSSIALNPPDEQLYPHNSVLFRSISIIKENFRQGKYVWIFLKKHLKKEEEPSHNISVYNDF